MNVIQAIKKISFFGSKRGFVSLCEKMSSVKFYAAAAPTLWVVLFLVVPLLIVLKISFTESAFSIPPFSNVFDVAGDYALHIKLSLKNFAGVVFDHYYITAFINSVFLGILATIICLFIGFPIAYGISTARNTAKYVLILLIALSFGTSFLLRVYSWINFLSPCGLLNTALLKCGMIDEPIQFFGSYVAVCMGVVFCYLPFMIFPIYAVLSKIGREYIESALDLGCSPRVAFWCVSVPLSRSGVATGCVMIFAMAAGEFVIPELLGSADTTTFGRVLWNEFYTNLDWPMACALSVAMLTIVTLPIYLFQRRSRILASSED
jgi:putrescine transport system permease protein